MRDRERRDDPMRAVYNTAKWRKGTRLQVLSEEPICRIAKICVEKCGRAMPSTEVDHIIPVRTGIDPFLRRNLQGACHDCHAWKTATEKKQQGETYGENRDQLT
jgi:5-methylcytosine-specific restriction endonuclease McrA